MAGFTDAYERELLDNILVSDVNFLILFNADPTDTGSVTNEVSGVGYQRVSLSGSFESATGTDGLSLSTAQLAFAEAGAGGWGLITHLGIGKSGVAGTDDVIMHSPIIQTLTISEFQTFTILIGNMGVIIE